MSASFNHCTLLGNLVRDPDVRFTPQGVQVVDVSIALNHTWKDESGDKREEVAYVDIVFWAKLADVAGKYLKKGSQALVSGRLQQDHWESKSGEKRSRLRVVADNLQLLGPRTDSPAPAKPAAPVPAAAPRSRPEPDFDDVEPPY